MLRISYLAHWLYLTHFQCHQISISTVALLVTWGTSAFLSTKPTVFCSLHWGFKTIEKCYSKSRKQWAIISPIYFPISQMGSKKIFFSLTNYVINCRRGCKHSPFSSFYGCISWVLRTLSLSVCTCPFSTPMPYQNTTTSTVTKAMLNCNELMNRIWEHRGSHSSLSSIASCTNTGVDIFSPIKPVILINVESIGVTIFFSTHTF